jgi:hypothetical protein
MCKTTLGPTINKQRTENARGFLGKAGDVAKPDFPPVIKDGSG